MAKHRLIWMAVSKGQCECGKQYDLDPEDARTMTQTEAQNEILDLHNLHKAQRKEAGW